MIQQLQCTSLIFIHINIFLRGKVFPLPNFIEISTMCVSMCKLVEMSSLYLCIRTQNGGSMYVHTIYIPINYLHIGASTNGPWDFKVNFGHGGGGHGASSFFIGGYSQQVENGPI